MEDIMAKFCRNCGSLITDDEKFCRGCGKPIEQPAEPKFQKSKCAYCGAELKATSKFCPICGKTVGAARNTVSQVSTPKAPVCAYCAAGLKATSKFCPKCGKSLAAVQPSQMSPQLGNNSQHAQCPDVYPGVTPNRKKLNPGLVIMNSLLALLAIGLMVLIIRFVPEKIQESSAPDSPFEENVFDEEVQADYDTLRAGKTLLGEYEEDADENMPYYNDYSWMSEENGEDDE